MYRIDNKDMVPAKNILLILPIYVQYYFHKNYFSSKNYFLEGFNQGCHSPPKVMFRRRFGKIDRTLGVEGDLGGGVGGF